MASFLSRAKGSCIAFVNELRHADIALDRSLRFFDETSQSLWLWNFYVITTV